MKFVYSIILPAYNEERTIKHAINETRKFFLTLKKPFEIIVVDDGSKDDTVRVVQQMVKTHTNVRLIRQKKNNGKGMAVKAGVAAAHGEALLFLDCDLATLPSEAKAFIPELQNADIIIGSRRMHGSKILIPQPYYRIILGRMFNLFVRWYLHIPFKDTQCGFKLFSRHAANIVFSDLKTSGWTFDAELLLRAQRANLRIIQKPVTWRNGRESRVHLGDMWQIFRELRNLKHFAC